MYYVYIIKSISHPDQVYIGATENIKKRIANHNAGTTPHTAKYVPWRIVVSLIFEDKVKAYEFERYLKSGSGRAFAAKRFF